MLRIDFLYKVENKNLEILLKKFEISAGDEFKSDVTNTKIEMAMRSEGNIVYVSLNIYYNDINEYQIRSDFEFNHPKWQEIWFKPDDIFTLVSKEIYYVN